MTIVESAVVRMVMGFAGSFLHGEIPGHRRFSRTDDRIEKRLGRLLEPVLGEELAVDFDPDAVVELRDADSGRRRGRRANDAECQ